MATTTLMSFAEFERLDQGPDDIELLKGELIRMPPAQRSHMEICERLYDLMKPAVETLRKANPGLNLGKVHMEMGYRFSTVPASWLKPDVSVTQPEQPGDRFYLGAPRIVFEIVSEFDRAPDLDRKIALYLANGASEVWLIYPSERYAWVYDGTATARQETLSIHTNLLPGIDIPLHEIL